MNKTISTEEYIGSCLSLFKALPFNEGVGESESNRPIPLMEYGLVLGPNSIRYEQEVRSWLLYNHLDGKQLNSSFHKSWEVVLESTEEELLTQQLLHYFSTYGLESLGWYTSASIYIPHESLGDIGHFELKVIKTLSKQELIEKSLSMLCSGIALKQETITQCLNILLGSKYEFNGNEAIKNKEARVILADWTGVLPTNEQDLFGYLFYKATGGDTLVVSSEDNIEAIKESGYELPILTQAQEVELSKAFLRDSRRYLWFAIKQAHPSNKRVVNRLSKLADKHHKPLPTNVLGSLTHKEFSISQVINACQNANTFQVIRTLNGVKFYLLESESRFYGIRNGKGWTREKACVMPKHILKAYEGILQEELRSRLRTQKVYYPSHVDYALPVSEKAFVGNIPRGTIITFPKDEEGFLIGIYWEGDRVDLDLRMDSSSCSLGWNTQYRIGRGDIAHSGDITSAPEGASEWIRCTKLTNTFEVKVNRFRGPEEQPFKFLLAYGDMEERSYVCHPTKVFLEVHMFMAQEEISLGLVEQDGNDSLKFLIGGLGSGQGRVGKYGPLSETRMRAMSNQALSSVRLSDLIPSTQTPSEADIDLSPESLQRDSLMKLFT